MQPMGSIGWAVQDPGHNAPSPHPPAAGLTAAPALDEGTPMPSAQAYRSQSAVAHVPPIAQPAPAQAAWARYHFYNSGVLSSKLSVTRDDKKSVVFDAKMRFSQVVGRKPNVELRRMDGSLVGACLVHGNCMRGYEVVFYSDEKCKTPMSSMRNDSFAVPGINVQLSWKNKSNGAGLFTASRKLVDNANNVLAVYHSSVALSKKGSVEVVSGLQPYLFDFIMLATLAEVVKRAMEQAERSRHNQERRNHMNHHHAGHQHGNHRHHHC